MTSLTATVWKEPFDAGRLRPTLKALQHGARTAGGWWLEGARAIVPAAWLDAVPGRGDALLLLEREDDGVRGHLIANGTRNSVYIVDAERCLPMLDDWLRTIGHDRANIRLGLTIEKEQCLGRSFMIPEAAVVSLPSVLEQEILRRTPFDLDEIWHAAKLTRRASGPHAVQQWIVRRDRVRSALTALAIEESDLDFLSVGAAADATIIALRGNDRFGPRPAKRVLRVAVASAMAATIVALLTWDSHESAALDALSHRVEAARAASRTGPDGLGVLSSMVVRKSGPGLLRIWSEVTRLLPDDTYLKGIRLADGSITIDGFSGNAVDLVRVVDSSPLFVRATLVGTIEPSPAEGKDRFSLSFDMRSKPSKGHSAAPLSDGPRDMASP